MQQYDSGYAGRLYSAFKAAIVKAQNTLTYGLEELAASLSSKFQNFADYQSPTSSYAIAGIGTAGTYDPTNVYFSRRGGARHNSPSFKRWKKEQKRKEKRIRESNSNNKKIK